ncbi:MAG: metal-sensing transcriptional repressor [bacterium]|nr:metal-sensing transcriptional repressor [bacterium]
MEERQQKIVNRLHRIEGQARGIENMIREQRDIKQIVQQLEAMRSATNQIISYLIENRFCSKDSTLSSDDIAYLRRFIKRL